MRLRIDSTEDFSAESLHLQRGENEIEDDEFEALPEGTKRKLRILENHGVVRVRATSAAADPNPSQSGKNKAAIS